jgi:hypothetical protein
MYGCRCKENKTKKVSPVFFSPSRYHFEGALETSSATDHTSSLIPVSRCLRKKCLDQDRTEPVDGPIECVLCCGSGLTGLKMITVRIELKILVRALLRRPYQFRVEHCCLFMKRESERYIDSKLIYECRCDERLKAKAEGSTRLTYSGLRGGLEHLKIETTRLIDERL